ncbi:hypothetical protein [Ramlibacter henchirensis]|nr:hypothetical protein [Ramlibacter henchirensis]
MASLQARTVAHFGVFDPATLAGLWSSLSLLGAAASLLLGGAALSC